MYELVSAIARDKNGDGSWSPTLIGDIALNTLFINYTHVYAVLHNAVLPDNVALDLSLLRNQYLTSTLTFNQFLTANGNATLPTMAKENAIIKEKKVRYADVFKAGYKITNTAPNTPPNTNHVYQDKTWLHLHKTGVNYQHFHQKCMVNVNGFYHMIDHDASGIYVVDGMKSNFISGLNLMGIVGFGDVGTLTYIPITSNMLYKQTPDQKYKDNVFVDLGVDVSDKTVILVLGGYLHIMDTTTFRTIDNTRIQVNFGNLPFLERYHESKRYIDLSSLPIDKTNRNPNQVDIANFFSDAVISAYMTLSQSFFVILDAKDLFKRKHFVRPSKIPDLFISDTTPDLPLVTGYGKLSNHWATFEDQKWSIALRDSTRSNYLHNTIEMRKQPTESDHRLPNDPVRNSRGYFLEIGKSV